MNERQESRTIVERQTTGSGVDIVGAAGATVFILENIPCGFARDVRVFLSVPASGIQTVIMRMYARNKTLFVDTTLAAGPLAAGTYSYVFPQATVPIGQSCTLGVTLDAGGAPANSFVHAYVEAIGP
jgi:hypothetical protein